MRVLREWLDRRNASRQGALDSWSTPTRPESSTPSSESADDELEAVEVPVRDWTSDLAESIPPWRRNDRALIDVARSATHSVVHETPELSASLARDLRRLADLNADAVLSDVEFIAGV